MVMFNNLLAALILSVWLPCRRQRRCYEFPKNNLRLNYAWVRLWHASVSNETTVPRKSKAFSAKGCNGIFRF